MKLSIIIPVYNEKNTVAKTIKRVATTPLDMDREIVVVDDGSTDGTKKVIKDLEGEYLKKAFHKKNRGKGAAIRTALGHVTGDIVIIQDADLEYNPEEYPKVLKPITDGKSDVVYGSRFVGSDAHRVLYFWHMIGNKFLTLLSNMLTNLTLTDMETGYKVFRRDIISSLSLEEDGFGFEPEVTAKIAKLKCRIYEVGISYTGRTYEEGKKIGWRDGVKTIWCIIKYNLL